MRTADSGRRLEHMMARIPPLQTALGTAILVLLLVTRSGHAHTEMISVVIGGRDIQIPVPAGFVELDMQLSPESSASWRPAGTRLLTVFEEQNRASANSDESRANGRIIFVQALEKFSDNSPVTHNDFAELKLKLRTDESWLPGSLVSENTDDSILFMTAGETRSGGNYVKATRVMMVRSRIVVFTLIQWSDAHVPATAARELMDDWRSQCRDANRVESDLVDRLILAFSTGGDSPHAGAETSTDPPIRVGWGIKREDDRRLRQPGQRTNSMRKPRSWRAYPILWLSSNAKPLLIGVGVIACLVIAGFFILWLLVPVGKGAESEEASERHGHGSAVDDSSATQVGDEVTAMANDQAEVPRTGDQR